MEESGPETQEKPFPTLKLRADKKQGKTSPVNFVGSSFLV
jgi:hypothetical protein